MGNKPRTIWFTKQTLGHPNHFLNQNSGQMVQGKIPLWFLTIMFVVSCGIMTGSMVYLFDYWSPFWKSFNSIMYYLSAIHCAILVAVLVHSKY